MEPYFTIFYADFIQNNCDHIIYSPTLTFPSFMVLFVDKKLP